MFREYAAAKSVSGVVVQFVIVRRARTSVERGFICSIEEYPLVPQATSET